jgi:hypothetical protein
MAPAAGYGVQATPSSRRDASLTPPARIPEHRRVRDQNKRQEEPIRDRTQSGLITFGERSNK